jgi:prepilin-type N-terminal cleavage/methylation domain-containing protein
MQEQIPEQRDGGFTLIELLIAIVVVGILAAVAIVGINGLTNRGQAASCTATKDAALAASAVHYANNNTYPANWAAMTGATPAELQLNGGLVIDGTDPLVLNGKGGWTLTMTAGTATTAPTFTGAGLPAGQTC